MTDWALWGTLVNTGAVLLGSMIGLFFCFLTKKYGEKRTALPRGGESPTPEGERSTPRTKGISDAVMKALGLCAAVIGVSGALKVGNMAVMILSMALGGFIGTLLDLDGLLKRFGAFAERKLHREDGRFAEGLVSATMVYCVGALTVTGAIESGVQHTHTIYYAKSVLDFVTAIVFASTMGMGVLFSSVLLFAVQSSLTLLAVLTVGAISELIIGEVMAVGSLLVLALGLNIMGVSDFKVVNYLPAMFLPIGLCPLFELIF